MNETNDPLDEAFAEQLRALVPTAMPDGQRSGDQPGLVSVLYEAGYRAGSEQPLHRVTPSRRPMTWLSVVAASLLTAALTTPVAYRVGQRSLETDSGTLDSGALAGGDGANRQGTVGSSDSRHAESLRQAESLRHAEMQDVDDDANESDESPSIAPKTDSEFAPASLAIKPFDFKQLARLWQPDWKLREPPTDTLTAFHGASLDDLPRSHWIVTHDDPMIPRETLSVGDFDAFSLGLEVNPR
ncbi:hypothetical protein [Planctomycetes bacterium TBK1r]|uniref:Uncharacterized protein n=1 Tax=Stieleria magnilauensis TaxID=2527963 RepID=A0ABX5XSS2_9BACT|nr:hypothetical protein TBK1r_29680 [Planctomycetes bacterium TBK1r]